MPTNTAAPGTLSAFTITGWVTVGPTETPVRFGRNRPEVEICIGEDDLLVSRQHGLFDHRLGRWWVTNLGRTPIRVQNFLMLHSMAEPVPLQTGRTPLFLQGSNGREHLLELYVSGPEGGRPPARHNHPTVPPQTWWLDAEERLTLVVIGQNYLLNDPQPRPLTRMQAAEQLAGLRPGQFWDEKRVDRVIARVRKRLAGRGVRYIQREELKEPIGNSLTENLLRELVQTTTLTPADLAALEEPLG